MLMSYKTNLGQWKEKQRAVNLIIAIVHQFALR